MKKLRVGDLVVAVPGAFINCVNYDEQVVKVTRVSECGVWICIKRPHASHPDGYVAARFFKLATKKQKGFAGHE